jgi:hypothetical protein
VTALYIKRGYPSKLVHTWLKNNIDKRWSQRLSTRTQASSDELLVLKSEYNTAWNYFSAKELEETLLGYWRKYCDTAASLGFDGTFPVTEMMIALPSDRGGLKDVSPSVMTEFDTSDGLRPMPDLRKTDILDRKIIVSKKRTRNLFDLASLWKKTVLSKMEEEILSNPEVINVSHSTELEQEPEAHSGINDDQDETHVHRRSRTPDYFVTSFNKRMRLGHNDD